MRSYQALLKTILDEGKSVPTRAVLQSTGQKIGAISIFGHQFRHNLRNGFPLLTTKKVSWHNIVHELVWFITGSTNISYLTRNNVHIWDQWADKSGFLGPVYGVQWRRHLGFDWKSHQGVETDQLANVLRDIELVRDDPSASPRRRLIVSAWNPPQVADMGLPPCHTLFQFGVIGGSLSCHMFMRSADLFLGVPYNIASYAALTHLVAAMTGLEPGELIVSFSDLHIYDNHIDQVREQIGREPHKLPELYVSPPRTLDEVSADNFHLVDYRHHPALKGEVAV
ncbi:thymidylate synthase [Singulisphaera rosea]